MNASIKDVAKRAGVSIATVSRVINNSAGVKETKRAAVEEALEYYDYQPSQFGRGLVTGSSGIIGVYSPFKEGSMFQNGYMLECLRGIDSVISRSKYSLLLINELARYYENEKVKPQFFEYVNQKKIDGLIVLSVPSNDRFEDNLKSVMDTDFPVGYIGRKLHENGVNVYAQYEGYMTEAVEEMYRCGHRRILLQVGDTRHGSSLRIKERCESRHRDLELVIQSININTDAAALKSMFQSGEAERCTAVVSEGLDIARKSISAFGYLGKKVPEDISFISVEHMENQGAQMLPEISCYYVPALEMGETIARKLIERLDGEKDSESSRIYHPSYQERGSVKKLKR